MALAVAAALTEAGIQVPVPRRDLHITGFNQNDGSENTHLQPETKSRHCGPHRSRAEAYEIPTVKFVPPRRALMRIIPVASVDPPPLRVR